MTDLRFPAEIAVGELWWPTAWESPGSGPVLATGVVEVPEGTAVRLTVHAVAEVGVSDRAGDGMWTAPAGRVNMPPLQLHRCLFGEGGASRKGMPDGAVRKDGSIRDRPGEPDWVARGDEPVDLGFLYALPADSVFELNITGRIVQASFAAAAHVAPGLRDLSVYLDDLAEDAPSVIAGLTALESLSLAGHILPEDGSERRLDDYALSVIADLPALQSLSLLGGAYTEQGLQHLGRLTNLRRLHIEKAGLTPSMFRFAEAMPALAELEGLDEYPDNPWTAAEVDELRRILPHVSVC